jgi:multidrug efflux pump subunit AcrB
MCQGRSNGLPLFAALVEAGAVRFKPIFPTRGADAVGVPAIYVVPRDDGTTPRTQIKEMKTWLKIGRN